MSALAYFLLCSAAIVVGVECSNEKRHVAKDPLIDMYAQQELLLKSIEKIVVEKFAKLDAELKSVKNDIEVKVANFENNVNARIDSLKQNIDVDHQFLKTMCPHGYTRNTHGCYKLGLVSVNWDTALSTCQAVGAHLVSLESSGELQALGELMKRQGAPNNYYRVGGRKVNGAWRWVYGEKSFAYTNWRSGRPDDGGECVEMLYKPGDSNHLEWYDFRCTTSERFICEL